MTILPQHQEMLVFVLDQEWGKHQVVFSNLWHLYVEPRVVCMHTCEYVTSIFLFVLREHKQPKK